jgi:hypothetical protein
MMNPAVASIEPFTVWMPRQPDPSKRMIFYFHGANQAGIDLTATTGRAIQSTLEALSQAGHIIISADWGGLQTYGNQAFLDKVEAWWTWWKATGLCAKDKFIVLGASMGTLSGHRVAKEHPTWVAGMSFWLPFVDVEAGRISNYVGVRDPFNTAWGLPLGSYIGGADQTPAPFNSNPMLYASAMAAIPTHMWYSTADPISANMATYLTSRGSSAVGHITSTIEGHTEANALGADKAFILAFVKSLAYA